MQVLSQLSYNPTSIGPLAGVLSDACPAAFVRLLGGRVRRLHVAGLHHPGSLQIEGSAYCSRVIALAASITQATARSQIGPGRLSRR